MGYRAITVGLLVFWIAYSGDPSPAQTAEDFFNDQVLHEIRFFMHSNDWATLKKNYLDNTYYPADFEWKFQGQTVPLENVRVRSRGWSSRSDIKPGFRVDIDRDEPGRRFLGLRSFVLRNHAQDASLLHDPLSMIFFRRLGFPAVREAHTKVYVNNEYIGLYSLVESIDKPFLTRVFGENDGRLYKYEFDTARTPYYFEYRGPDPASYVPVPFEAQTHESDPEPEKLEAMVRAINQTSDSEFVAAVSEYLDLKQFMAHVAVERFLLEHDGVVTGIGMNNFYLYRFENTRLFRFIPWDKDLTFVSAPEESIWHFVNDQPADTQNRLMRRAVLVPELRAAYLSMLARAATAAAGEGGFFQREVERKYQQIRTAALEDKNKLCTLPNGEPGPCSNEQFEAAIEALKQFARRRSKSVLEQAGAELEAASERSFTIPNRGSISWTTPGVPTSPVAGYARILPATGSSSVAGVAIFGFRQNDVLVTEAGVPGTPVITGGRVYAEGDELRVSTGLAIANPNDESVTLSFYFTDLNGKDYGQGTTTLAARSQIARFLNQSPFNGALPIRGSFTFTSSLPVAALTLRAFNNERSETLVTTLPVVELAAGSQDTLTLPHFADGGGWTSQIVLVNPTDLEQSGTLEFFNQGSAGTSAEPVEITIAGVTATSFAYTLPAHGARVMVTSGGSSATRSGSARITPATGSSAPSASAVFSFKTSGITVTEAGVPAVAKGASFRLYAETLGTPGEVGSIETGVALANPSAETLSVQLALTDLSGKSIGSASVSIPARGQIAKFLSQIDGFQSLKPPFQGILRITASTESGVAVIGLRGRYNERGDYLITTVPSVPEQAAGTTARETYFPHWVDGGGYTTQFVLFGTGADSATTGTFRTTSQNGALLPLALW
jgi:hypothetical protein